MQQHPAVRWITYQQLTQGFVVRCQACGAQGTVGSPQQVDAFAQQHTEHRSASPQHYGAGDLVNRATKALGIETCTPCEARRRALNARFPRLWRR